jgi:gluconate 2-dehydrogenase gamma chain
MTVLLVDRRTLIAEMLALVGASAVPSSALAALAAGPAGPGARGAFLDPADMALLREMAEAMIPRTDTPGAADAGVPEFIDGLMIDWAGEGARAQLRRAVSDYRALANSRGKTPAARLEAMVELDRRSFAAPAGDAGAEAYRWLKRIVFLAYRTSEAAFKSYVPNPGSYRGNLSRAEYDALVGQYSVSAG